MSIVLGEEQRKRTLVPAPPAYTTKPSTRRLAYTMGTRKLSTRKLSARKLGSKSQSRRSLSNGASSRHLNRKDTEVSVISVEARRSQLEIMAAATGINSNNANMDGQESSLHLSEEALECMRRDYVRKLSLEILSSTTHDTRTELHCDVLLELLKDDVFFKDLSDSVRRELCRVMSYKNLAPDMAVFRRGDPGDNFYVILSGSVAVYADEIEGMPLAELREGQGFGEMALAHDAPRNATIVTRDQTELLFIPKNEYRSILRKLQFKEYNEKTSCFKSLPHFRHWDEYALMGLSKVCKLITEPANKLMCRQGDVVSHIYIVKKGRCRLIKEIAVPRIKCRLGESQTADRLIGKRDCLVDAETLEGGSFFGENGVLVLDKATQPPPPNASLAASATVADAASHDSSSEATVALGRQASASASTQRMKVAQAAILSDKSDSESDSSESDDGNDGDVNQDDRVSKSKPIATNSGKRPRRPSQILKAAIPELYPASMVTDCETQFLVVRLVDFLRCCTTTDHDELLQFAAYRVHSLHHKTVQKRLANQIRWEREKRNVLLTAKIPKYSRALQLHRPHHQQHSIEELHDHPFRC